MTTAITPNDAEEQLRPFLGDVFETTDACLAYTVIAEHPPRDLVLRQLTATNAALDKALQLLGVRS